MKKIILFLFFSNSIIGYAQGVGIGTNTPNSSAQLDISSNTKGLLIPRMTDVEKNTISSPCTRVDGI
ncbi:MAG: hypothetical protein IPP48_02570 [Chitinophagaceae bacterium]|nr:hypothetical protein [Chitinophagaceae bacterium]